MRGNVTAAEKTFLLASICSRSRAWSSRRRRRSRNLGVQKQEFGRLSFCQPGDRFIAFALDSALLFGLFAIVDAWAFMRWGAVEGTELQLTTAAVLVALMLNSTILFLYCWLLEAGCGATLGKALVGIRVVGSSGRGYFLFVRGPQCAARGGWSRILFCGNFRGGVLGDSTANRRHVCADGSR